VVELVGFDLAGDALGDAAAEGAREGWRGRRRDVEDADVVAPAAGVGDQQAGGVGVVDGDGGGVEQVADAPIWVPAGS